MNRPLTFACVALSIVGVACSDDETSSSSSSSGTSGTSSSGASSSGSTSTSSGSQTTTKFSCRLNGACYKCPTSSAVIACTGKDGPTAAGCTSEASSFCD